MPLGDDPLEWKEEVDAAREFSQRYRCELDKIRKSYLPGPSQAVPGERVTHEPVAFGLTAWLKPQLLWDDAKVDVQSPIDPEEGEAIQDALNNWIVTSNLRARLDPLATDHIHLRGVSVTTLRRDETVRAALANLDTTGIDKDIDPEIPVIERIPIERHFVDSGAMSLESAQFEGHDWVEDYDRLLERIKAGGEKGWDKSELESAATSDGDALADVMESRNMPGRKVVKATQVWVPWMVIDGKKPEDGYNGAILTLANSGQSLGHFIRKPIAFKGPPEGPYTNYGVHNIPNTPFFTSTLAAMLPTIDALNRVRETIMVAIEQYKQGLLYDAANSKLARELKEGAKTGSLIGVSNLFSAPDGAPGVVPFQIGGPTAELYTYLQDLKELVDRYIGQTDMQRGALVGKGTATEAAMAGANADIRAQWVKSQWVAAVTANLRKVAWYLAVNKNTLMPITRGFGTQGMQQPGVEVYLGGKITPAEFERLHLRIAPYSMEMADEGARGRRALETFQMLVGAVPLIAQFPMLPWDEMLDWLGDSLNMPELGRFIPEEALLLMRQGGPAVPAQAPGKPRTSLETQPRPRPPAARRAGGNGLPGAQSGAMATEAFR